MLNGRDPQTGRFCDHPVHIFTQRFIGQGLTDSNIQAQMLTFLVAGHETTSGMLSFAMTHILKHPDVYARIRQEVDTVLGKEPIKFEHLSKLTYINGG
jgi:cytochrome P450/NADPH-cytochrome P450 reductase